MPIYEYQCQACDHRMEEFQKITDEALTICPSCQEPKLRKIISATHFQLKGTGWYETDFSGKQKLKTDHEATDKSSAENSTNVNESAGSAESTAVPATKQAGDHQSE